MPPTDYGVVQEQKAHAGILSTDMDMSPLSHRQNHFYSGLKSEKRAGFLRNFTPRSLLDRFCHDTKMQKRNVTMRNKLPPMRRHLKKQFWDSLIKVITQLNKNSNTTKPLHSILLVKHISSHLPSPSRPQLRRRESTQPRAESAADSSWYPPWHHVQ